MAGSGGYAASSAPALTVPRDRPAMNESGTQAGGRALAPSTPTGCSSEPGEAPCTLGQTPGKVLDPFIRQVITPAVADESFRSWGEQETADIHHLNHCPASLPPSSAFSRSLQCAPNWRKRSDPVPGGCPIGGRSKGREAGDGPGRRATAPRRARKGRKGERRKDPRPPLKTALAATPIPCSRVTRFRSPLREGLRRTRRSWGAPRAPLDSGDPECW